MMKNRKNLLSLSIAACMFTGQVFAAADASTNDGKVDAQLKFVHVLGDAGNGYDPSEGTAYLAKLKYTTPTWNNLKLGTGFYVNGDFLNMTDFDAAASDPDKRLARGLFVTNDGEEKALLGEFYVNYTNDMFEVNAGRQLYDTPLTTITYSTMPNFHTAFGVAAKPTDGLKLSFDQVTQMSFGARSMTDFSLIGEGTQTAGAVVRPDQLDGGQAKFHDIAYVATGNTTASTNGISVLNATYTGIKGLELAAWDYYAEDISNTFYADVSYGMPVSSMKLKLEGQYMLQKENGTLVQDNLFDNTGNFANGIDYNLFGIKATLKGANWMAFAAYNKSSGDTGMYNSWGGDPGYTSSIFSRNEYRENVSAYKIGAKYDFMKNLFGMVSYADYGQSDSIGNVGSGPIAAQTDATEADIVLAWKPTKQTMLKLFHANRTSEFDGVGGVERTQAHTRLIATWDY